MTTDHDDPKTSAELLLAELRGLPRADATAGWGSWLWHNRGALIDALEYARDLSADIGDLRRVLGGVIEERDAALARVAELEAGLREIVDLDGDDRSVES